MTSDETPAPRRLSLLFELYLASQASRRFMRLALADAPLSGEEFALFSYLFANGARTLSQTARDLGIPITSLATTLAPLIESGRIERRPHPRDRRARLLSLTDAGMTDMRATIPPFSASYRVLLARLDASEIDVEELFTALAAIRSRMDEASDELEFGDPGAGAIRVGP